MVVGKPLEAAPHERVTQPSAHDLQAMYLDEVLRFVSSFVRPPAEAEDVVMEVFQAAFLNLHRLKRKDDPRVWLLGIARRKVADSLRIRYRRAESPLLDTHAASPSDQEQIERQALVREILT